MLNDIFLFCNFFPGTLSSLAILSIKDCPKLVSILTTSIAKTLTSLKDLIIERCNSLKHIVGHERVNQQKENIVEDDHEFHSDISIFQSLKKVHISQGEFTIRHPVQIFQNLQEVEVYRCRELKDIFSISVVRGLDQLKVLKIQECNMLDKIFGYIDSLTYQDEKELAEIVEEGKHPHLYNTLTPSTTVVNNSPGTFSIFLF